MNFVEAENTNSQTSLNFVEIEKAQEPQKASDAIPTQLANRPQGTKLKTEKLRRNLLVTSDSDDEGNAGQCLATLITDDYGMFGMGTSGNYFFWEGVFRVEGDR